MNDEMNDVTSKFSQFSQIIDIRFNLFCCIESDIECFFHQEEKIYNDNKMEEKLQLIFAVDI